MSLGHDAVMSKVGRAQAVLERWLLGLVLVFAAVGLAVPGPARTTVAHHGIDATLAVLVFTSGVSVPSGALVTLRGLAQRLIAVVVSAAVVLPLLAFAASCLVSSGNLRHGILAIGVAPAEVATVGIAGMAGGDIVVAAALLVASALVSVVAAGPVLSLLGGSGVSTGGVIGNLALVVGLPLAAGLAVGWRLRWPGPTRSDVAGAAVFRADVSGPGVPGAGLDRAGVLGAAEVVSTVAVLVLVALVASQVHLTTSYLAVVGALVAVLAGSTALGSVLGSRLAVAPRRSVLLHVSMRDFAVASGIASAAFGADATGPLGVYGLLVITWGSVVAQRVRRQDGRRSSD
jgi:predicted Na+-dependent transporter